MWTKLRQKDWDRLERIQAKILKRILEIPSSTPYWGILTETGIWPIRAVVDYHRMIFFQNAMTSDERLAKQIIKGQREVDGENWTKETKNM